MRSSAVKAVGTKIDATVLEFREGVQRESEEMDNKINILKIGLVSELEARFAEATEKLREEKIAEEDRYRRIEERTVEEAMRRQEHELLTMKEKIVRNQAVLTEKLERSKKDDSGMIRKAAEKAKENGNNLLKECSEGHQRTLSAFLREGIEKKALLQEKIKQDLSDFEKGYRKELRDIYMVQKRR